MSGRVRRGLVGVVVLILTSVIPAGVLGQATSRADLAVRYPSRFQRVASDSNFLFGSIAPPGAALEINGEPVEVGPGGAFLAWIEVPPATRGDTAFYRFRVLGPSDTSQVDHPIRRPLGEPPTGAARPWVHPSGLGDRPESWVRQGERVRFEFVAERGATLALEVGALRVPLPNIGAERGMLDRYGADVDLSLLRQAACEAARCSTAPDPDASASVQVEILSVDLVAREGGLVRRHALTIPFAVLDAGNQPGGRLEEAPDPTNGQSGVVVARPTAFGPYRWRLPNGAVVRVTGRLGNRLRVSLASGLEAWVLREDLVWTDPPVRPASTHDARAERADAGTSSEDLRVEAIAEDVVSFRVGLSRPVPAWVEVTGERSLSLFLPDTFGAFDRIALGVGTGVEVADWRQLEGPVTRVDLELAWPLWGYHLSFEQGDAGAYEGPAALDTERAEGAGSILRLDLRRPPTPILERPLSGRRIAIDPGHPGGGSTGPSGLYEGDANLAVALHLEALLEAAGAEALLVRTGSRAVGLYERTRRARDAGADLFVSIHNNALPDGVRPFDRAGTTTYYHHPHAARLAHEVQAGMVTELGLMDRGVVWGDLAVAREAWMPSVLVEGAFMMVPEQEAALRTPEFQLAYARGVFRGIERYLASLGESALPDR